jgi:hypothetical protein
MLQTQKTRAIRGRLAGLAVAAAAALTLHGLLASPVPAQAAAPHITVKVLGTVLTATKISLSGTNFTKRGSVGVEIDAGYSTDGIQFLTLTADRRGRIPATTIYLGLNAACFSNIFATDVATLVQSNVVRVTTPGCTPASMSVSFFQDPGFGALLQMTGSNFTPDGNVYAEVDLDHQFGEAITSKEWVNLALGLNWNWTLVNLSLLPDPNNPSQTLRQQACNRTIVVWSLDETTQLERTWSHFVAPCPME